MELQIVEQLSAELRIDQLYMVALGRASLDPSTLNLAPLRPALLRRYARAFSAPVQRRLKALMVRRTAE